MAGVHEFAMKYLNTDGTPKKIKVGGGQCGELVQEYFKYCIEGAGHTYTPIYCNATGYVKDWITDQATNAKVTKYFNQYPYSKDILRDGDIIVWTTKYVNYPHAAISRKVFRSDGYMLCLAQNMGHSYVEQVYHLCNQKGMYILRLKEWEPKVETSTTKTYNVGDKIVLTKDIPAYPTATRAMKSDRSTATYKKGTTYYVWKKWTNGALNLTKNMSSAGGWVNPKDI